MGTRLIIVFRRKQLQMGIHPTLGASLFDNRLGSILPCARGPHPAEATGAALCKKEGSSPWHFYQSPLWKISDFPIRD